MILKFSNSLTLPAVTALSILSLSSAAHSATVMADRTALDHVLQGNFENGNPDVFLQNNSNARRVGTGGAGGAQRVNQPVLGFVLPNIPAGDVISAADFSLTMDTTAVSGVPIGFEMVVSLMSQTSVGGFSAADFTEDSGSLGTGTLVATVPAGDVANNSVEIFSLSGAALTQIASLYGPSGVPSQTEVFFRLSTSSTIDTTAAANDNDRFQLARDGAPLQVTRTLEFTTAPIPEPSAIAFFSLAALGLFARRR